MNEIKLGNTAIHDLRSALVLLEQSPKHLIKTNEQVDPDIELASVYRYIGGGATLPPPTQTGPAMLFKNIKGYDNLQIIAGVLAHRERIALMMGTTVENLSRFMLKALQNDIEPVTLAKGKPATCQEVVHKSPLDINKIIPGMRNTKIDGGPYFCMGLMRCVDRETGDANLTIHRLCVQGPDTLTASFVPIRHNEHFRKNAEKKGEGLPISINIGVDPAIYLGACFEAPTTPLGYDELRIAGGIRQRPVELADCVAVNAKSIAYAEVVIEGELLPNERLREDVTRTGFSIPEFTGYMGPAHKALPVIKIKAITHRKNPILQTIVGPGEECANLCGIPTEASILNMLEATMPGRVKNVYVHPSSGGKLMAIIQFDKLIPNDEGQQRQAGIMALAAYQEVKHIIIVDPDVNIYDSNDVFWALTTRYQADIDTVMIPGVRCHKDDPSQDPAYNPMLKAKGITCKAIFDCTVPMTLRDRFKRAPFEEIDIARFLTG